MLTCIMKTILKYILLFGLIVSPICADDFDVLKSQYDSAINRVVEPINKTYETKLKSVLEKASREGDVQLIEKITEELKKLQTSKEEASIPSTNRDLERLFVGKAYKTPCGTTFHFEKNGAGWKTTGTDKTTFLWKIIDNGIVEYTGRVTSNSPLGVEYIKFGKKETFIGKSLNNINVPLTLVK